MTSSGRPDAKWNIFVCENFVGFFGGGGVYLMYEIKIPNRVF